MENKKIGILTQPLHDNYGGLLQAYALKETLKSLGYKVAVINRRKKPHSKWRLIVSNVKNRIYGKKANKVALSDKQKAVISKKTINFQKQYIPELSELIINNSGMLKLNGNGYSGFVVGSDQCWRPSYSPEIKNYFLDFLPSESSIKRVAYAASFGSSTWSFTEQDTKVCKDLLNKFDAISVREDSAVDMVSKYLGRDDALHVLDPTMLLSIKHYESLLVNESMPVSNGNMKVYVLDKTPAKERFIETIADALDLEKFEVMPKKRISLDRINNAALEDFQYPSPLEWIQGYKDAKFVVTDSFHGTVFSILFNIPFITVGNVHRGMARFESLLNMFNLSERLVTDIEKVDTEHLLNKNIDWNQVNIILASEKLKALEFLKRSLS